MPKMDEDLKHGCGQTFKYPGAYAKHGLKCDGRPPARSRIEGGSGLSGSDEDLKEGPRPSDPPRVRKASAKTKARRAKPARARSSVRREKKVARKKRDVALAVVVPQAKPVSPQDFLASLDFQIARLQRVREAVQEIA